MIRIIINQEFKINQYIVCKYKNRDEFTFIHKITEVTTKNSNIDCLMFKTIKTFPRLIQNRDYPAPEIMETRVFLRQYEIISILDNLEEVIELYPEEFIWVML